MLCFAWMPATRRRAKRIGALVKDKNYYVRVDTFNEGGITEGDSIKADRLAGLDHMDRHVGHHLLWRLCRPGWGYAVPTGGSWKI